MVELLHLDLSDLVDTLLLHFFGFQLSGFPRT